MSADRGGSRRDVHGIVLLDKPTGITSNAALQRVKRLYRARKAGHTGSLDPLASGLLPVCLGEATKISAYLLDADKFYRVAIRLGATTTTGDAEGDIVATRPVPTLGDADINDVLARFTGAIEQIPPMYSALKQQGQPLYRLARRGIEVERQPRRIAIYQLTLVEHDGSLVTVDVHCSKGTYVRTLAEDIGAALGCGGHVAELRRLKVGPFDGGAMISLDELGTIAERDGLDALDKWLQPMEAALTQWPDVRLSDEVAYFLKRGQPVLVPHAPTHGWVRIFGRRAGFMGIGCILDDGRVAPKRLVNI